MSSVNFKSVKIPQTHSKMKSIVNLSYNKKDTVVPNLIIPVMCKETYAGDVWNLKLTGFLRWLYLKVPSLDTLKLSLNVFYAEHIDLCQDAQSVLKGSGESEYDDRVEYNFPYITNMLMPFYALGYSASTSDFKPNTPPLYKPIHPYSFFDVSSAPQSDWATVKDQLIDVYSKNGINITFSILGDQKVITFPYDTCQSFVFSRNYLNNVGTQTKVGVIDAPLMGRAHIGGLYERIYGVVGDAPKFVNAEPVILYYLCIDFYYRAQQHIKPFVGRIKGVDKTIDEKCLEYVQDNPNLNYSGVTNFFSPAIVPFDGCVCNLWDENQSCLSRFINGNRTNDLNLSAVVDPQEASSIFYKFITYLNGGLCPVLKYPDYFTMATIKPSSADPVNLPFPSSVPVVGTGKALGLTDGSIEGGLASGPVGSGIGRLSGRASALNANVGTAATGSDFMITNAAVGVSTDPLNSQLIADFSASISIPSIVDLRRSALMQTYFEKINVNGFLFQDYMLAFFGQDVEDEHLRIPRLIGRASATFDIIPVVQQSGKSSQDGSPLGTLAGNAVANFSTGLMRFSCQMGGFVLANLSISGNNSYQEGYDRWCFERSSLDQYNPHFLGIGDQAIMNYELYNSPFVFNVISAGYKLNVVPSAQNVLITEKKTASENGLFSQSSVIGVSPYVDSANYPFNVNFSLVDTTAVGFQNAVNESFKGFGFIPRRQELRTAFNRIGGNFKSRSDLIKTINPSYASLYATSRYFFPYTLEQANFGVLSSVGSLDMWHLADDYDFEVRFSNDSSLNYFSTTDLATHPIPLNSSFLMASKPWQRLVEYNDVPPIYMSLNVIAHVVRTITAQSIQGQGVHL